MKIKVGILGASGYAGYELIKILNKHPKVNLVAPNSISHKGKQVKSVYKDFKGNIKFTNYSMEDLSKLDVVFTALPSGVSLELIPKLKTKVIDLGADYRFSNLKTFEKVYGLKHKEQLASVYGLPELLKEKIKKASLVGNPGCYATASLLSALPISKYASHIIFDCKSGYSGAGNKPSYVNQKKNYENDVIPYNIVNHRHKLEIKQFLKPKVSFTPHVVPFYRGLMATTHVLLKKKLTYKQIVQLYKDYYAKEPFVKVFGTIPEMKDVVNTNFCHLGGFEIDENNQLVIISVIDNLIKGASGQAVQNMNLMFGFKETSGLTK